MKNKLLVSILLCSVCVISCSHNNSEPETNSYMTVFWLNCAYIDDAGNDLLSDMYYYPTDGSAANASDAGRITTIHDIKIQINSIATLTDLRVNELFCYKTDSKRESFKSKFINMKAWAIIELTNTVDSTGIAKLNIHFPTLFYGIDADEIECHYRILRIADRKYYFEPYTASVEIEFDRILLNGVETTLRKVDPATGKITDEITNNVFEGTLVINPMQK